MKEKLITEKRSALVYRVTIVEHSIAQVGTRAGPVVRDTTPVLRAPNGSVELQICHVCYQ